MSILFKDKRNINNYQIVKIQYINAVNYNAEKLLNRSKIKKNRKNARKIFQKFFLDCFKKHEEK